MYYIYMCVLYVYISAHNVHRKAEVAEEYYERKAYAISNNFHDGKFKETTTEFDLNTPR